MLNKILIKIIKYKGQKLYNKNCKDCSFRFDCYNCNTQFIKNNIKAMKGYLKRRKI